MSSGKRDRSGKPPLFVWIPALCFAGLLIVFLLVAFFTTPNLTEDRRWIVSLIFPLLAGFSTIFMGGAVLLQVSGTTHSGLKFSISAVAGVAVFIICYFNPPHIVKNFIGYTVRPTGDFVVERTTTVPESKRVQSDTIYTGQNGDTKGTRIEIDLPAGAFDVSATTGWTCNCTKTSKWYVQGNKAIAEGTITSPEKLWGPRVWGELWLEATWKRQVTEQNDLNGVKLDPSVIYSKDVAYTLSQGYPKKVHIDFSRDAKSVYDTIDIVSKSLDPIPVRQTSQRGEFVALLSGHQLVISTVEH
jgi:hypothetical protein